MKRPSTTNWCAMGSWSARVPLPFVVGCLTFGTGCSPVEVLDFFPNVGEGGADARSVPAPELVVDGTMNLSSFDGLGRSCGDGGDAVAYSVASLTADVVTLASVPSARCILPGDEMLLINLQGAPGQSANVGSYELVTVAAVAEAQVELLAPKENDYGINAQNEGLGVTADTQRAVLQRVPRYDRVEIQPGGVLLANPWDGTRGGVLALRALREVVVDGRVAMDAAGFHGGRTIEPPESPGQQGESIEGVGEFAYVPNLGGGGGGIADQTTNGCQQDGYPGGGGGHVGRGSTAETRDLCNGVGAGEGGEPYVRSGRLFLGSGGGSAGTDNVRADNPPGGAGGDGGGIVWLLAGAVRGAGTISADGAPGVGDPPGVECLGGSTADCYDHSGPGGGGAGGSVRISAHDIDVGSISAEGGPGGNGNDTVAGNGGDGANGLVALD